MLQSDRFLKKVHSPYTTPVLNASDMCQANRDYYGCTSSSSDDEIDQHLPPTSAQYFARGGVPPPPSYVQATNNAARMSSPRTTRTATPESEPTTPHTPQGRDAISAIPETIFHSPLVGHCEFIQPPQIPNCDYPTPSFPCYRLFLGQIRFETTAAEVRWIVEYICGVRALKVESRGIGCFLAYFRTPDDMTRVQHLHKRVLFDHSGIWFARSDSQAEYLAGYVAKNLSHIGRGFRLPKDMMVVEEEKLTRALPIPSCPPPNYHLFPTQMPPPPHYYPPVSYDN